MTPGPEFAEVEQPFIDQLVSMGWKFTTGNLDHPSVTARENFRQVLLLDDLRKALVPSTRTRRANPGSTMRDKIS